MKTTRHQEVYAYLKSHMDEGTWKEGALIPSENELCKQFSVTRTTVRTALNALENEGHIERSQGKRGRVKGARQRLGLLTVKGFSEAAGSSVETRMLEALSEGPWPDDLPFVPHASEKAQAAMHFSRVRKINGIAVMHESNWFKAKAVPGLTQPFEGGSFFKSLSERHGIQITASEQELHALKADKDLAGLLQTGLGHPLLQIYIRFSTSQAGFFIYSRLLCNTDTYKIGNTYSR